MFNLSSPEVAILRERILAVSGLVLSIWGVALLCLAALDWCLYDRFLDSLLFR